MMWCRDPRSSTRGNPAFQGTLGVASREPSTISTSGRNMGLPWRRCSGQGPHLDWRQEPQASSPFLTPTAGSLQGWDRRVRPCLSNGTLLASRVVQWVSGPLSSCVCNLRVFPEDARGCHCCFIWCLPPQGCLQRGVRASGSFQERTGKSGSFCMWHHPRGSSRISS